MAYLDRFLDWAEAQVSAARGDTTRVLGLYARAESRAAAMAMRPTVWQARASAANFMSPALTCANATAAAAG